MTSPDGQRRADLTRRLDHLIRNQIAATVLHMHQIAGQLGRNATDLQCLHLLTLHGPCTAGELARQARLTTGAVTAIVDRLQNAGYVRREPDSGDRRKVIIVPDNDRVERDIMPYHAGAQKAMTALYDRYTSEQLAVIADFFEQLAAGYEASG